MSERMRYPGGSRNQRGSARRCNRFAGRIRSTNGLISDNYLPVNPRLRTSRPAALGGKAQGGKDGYRSYRALETSVTSRESGGRAGGRTGREINRARGSIDDVLTR